MHNTTFEYLNPTDQQKDTMAVLRQGFAVLATLVESKLDPGVDCDHVIRLLRHAGMWANVAVTRFPDGTPRP